MPDKSAHRIGAGWRIRCALACCLALSATLPASTEGLLRPEDRIVFIGDSITGQGGGQPNGWVAIVRKALAEAHALNRQTLIPLGGSGQTVGSWLNIEERSREMAGPLDVKEFDVKAELDRHADVLVIMLGMNDVLSSQMPDTAEGIRQWKETYRKLLSELRRRTTPRITALATPTPCTEDPSSPKNAAMERMVAALRELAAEEDCIVLPTRDTAWEVLSQGRKLDPGFHIAGDQVHPTPAGHAAIAAGMLRGLGEGDLAETLIRSASAGPPGQRSLSYEIRTLPPGDGELPIRFSLDVSHGRDPVRLDLPDGWKATAVSSSPGATAFAIEANPDRLVNVITIRDGSISREVRVPAAWLTGTCRPGGTPGWSRPSGSDLEYNPEEGHLPLDRAVSTGEGFAQAPAPAEARAGVPVAWRVFVGDVNYGGRASPWVVDFARLSYFRAGDVGYGLRWIFSDRDRPVSVLVSRPGFAGQSHAQVWINGERIFSGDPGRTKGQGQPAQLRQGWNLLSFKSSYLTWQWQVGIELKPLEGDRLDELRFSVSPPGPGRSAPKDQRGRG